MSMWIVLEKFMLKKENDSKVDKPMKLPVLVMWTNKKKRKEYHFFEKDF